MKYVKIENRDGTQVVVDISFTAKDNYEQAPDDTLMLMQKNDDGTFFKGEIFNKTFYGDNPRKKYYPKFEEYLDGIVKNDTEQQQQYIEKCNWVKNCIPRYGVIETLGENNND